MADLSKYRRTTPQAAPATDLSKYKKAQPSMAARAVKGAYEVEKGLATGVSKGATSTFLGLGEFGQKIQKGVAKGLDFITGGFANFEKTAQGGVFDRTSAQGQKARELVKPKGLSEKVGFGAEQAAEFLIPAGAASKAEKIVTTASKGLPRVIAPAARIIGKGMAQAVPAAGVNFIQTGGDAEAALKTGATAGALRSVIAGGGEIARGVGLPERLYTYIFRNSKNDMLKELKSDGIDAIRNTDPDFYQALLKEGAIKTIGGKAVVNETLAEQALARGLQGSSKRMADTVVKGMYKSELAAREVAKTHQGTIDLAEPQFTSVLKGLAEKYDDVGFGEISKQARDYAALLEKTGGKVPATEALGIRRFLDKMRIAASYPNPGEKLSLQQANLKSLTDTVRGRVNSVPGMQGVMKDYSFYIDALEALAKDATRRGNNAVIPALDAFLYGTSIATGSAMPAVVGGVRRALTMPAVMTGVGSALNKGTASQGLGAIIGSTSAGISPD
jgi:hypothetical protein